MTILDSHQSQAGVSLLCRVSPAVTIFILFSHMNGMNGGKKTFLAKQGNQTEAKNLSQPISHKYIFMRILSQPALLV